MPTNNSGGITQDRIWLKAPVPDVAEYVTPWRVNSAAMFVGTRSVAKLRVPFGSFSFRSPRMVSPATVTLAILPWSSHCWNWLYGTCSTDEEPNCPKTTTASTTIANSQSSRTLGSLGRGGSLGSGGSLGMVLR